jgi:hypothetical protein
MLDSAASAAVREILLRLAEGVIARTGGETRRADQRASSRPRHNSQVRVTLGRTAFRSLSDRCASRRVGGMKTRSGEVVLWTPRRSASPGWWGH